MSIRLRSKRICVTGGEGFVGRRVVARLRARGCVEVFVAPHAQYELTRLDDVERLYRAAEVISFCAGITLEEGILRTVEWYRRALRREPVAV